MDNLMQSVPATAAEADLLYEAINAPQEASASEPPLESAATETPAPTPAQQAAEEFWELSRKDVKTKVPLSQAKALAQQGLDYNEKMRAFNTERSLFTEQRQKWEAEKAELDKLVQKYKPIDEHFTANPQYWDRVNQVYNEAIGQTGAPAVIPQQVLAPYEERIAKLEGFISSEQEQRRIEKIKTEDQTLNQQIASFREKNPGFNWDTLDENNLSLEQKIINHAVDNKIGNFNAAARDFLYDQLVERAALDAKESVAKQIQTQHKKGVESVSRTPAQPITRVKNVRNRSYDNIAEEIKQEFGLA